MTRIITSTYIARPIEEVYNFVTTPGNWPRWSPIEHYNSSRICWQSRQPFREEDHLTAC